MNASVTTTVLDRLAGLVIKVFASRTADLGSVPAFTMEIFSRLSHVSDLNIGNPLATLRGAW